MATFRKGTGTVLSNGVPIANVTVSIYEKGTTDYCTIYSDEGVTPIDQTTDPILSDSAGRYAFYLDVGTYAQFRIFLDPSTAAEGYNFDEANADLDGVSMPSSGAKGDQGIQGVPGPAGQLVGSGAWATLTGYTEDIDVVENSGSGYVCKVTHTSGDHDDEPGVGAVWET